MPTLPPRFPAPAPSAPGARTAPAHAAAPSTVTGAVAMAVLWLAGCASTPLPPMSAPPSAPAASLPGAVAPPGRPVAPTVSLPDEQRRLATLFEGTPVAVELMPDQTLRATVPLKYAFDAGRAVVKPPLAAVLDRLVPSAASPGNTLRVEAPGDTPGTTSLARERAASTRDYLVGKGVPSTGFVQLGVETGDAVRVVIAPPVR